MHDAEHTLAQSTESLPALPELISDDEYWDESRTATPRAPSKASSRTNSPNMHTFLRCPNCDRTLKWVLVDKTVDGEHQIHRWRVRCDCERLSRLVEALKTEGDMGELFPVNCGSW